MSSSTFLVDFFNQLKSQSEAGDPGGAQTSIRDAIQGGKLTQEQASDIFQRLQPAFRQGIGVIQERQKLSPEELAKVKADFRAGKNVGPDKLSAASRQDPEFKAEVDAFTERKLASSGSAEEKVPRIKAGETPKASIQTREDFENTLQALKESKASTKSPKKGSKSRDTKKSLREVAAQVKSGQLSREAAAILRADIKGGGGAEDTQTIEEAFETAAPNVSGPSPKVVNTPAPNVSGPSPKVVNTPVTPTNNVTKPNTNSGGSKKDRQIERAIAATKGKGLTKEQEQDLAFGIVQSRTQPKFDKKQFNFLLDRLEGSKIRQNRDAQSQERQNIYSRGLASMFSNF